MTRWMGGLAMALHLALVLVWPLILVGIVRRVKARLACRRGPPMAQAIYDLAKLLQKEEVYATTTTWIFRAAPRAAFVVTVVVALMIPTLATTAPLGGQADLIVVIYMLGLARFIRTVAAMDTGTAFGGLGASREAFIASLAEPALVLALWCMALLTGTTAIPAMIERFSLMAMSELSPVYPLVALAMVVVAIAENARIPVDDPTTHLELTMVHEAMGLEYSGPGLALVEWGSAVQLGIYLSLIANLFAPLGLWVGEAALPAPPALSVSLLSYCARTGVLAIAIGVLESSIARLKFFRIPDVLSLAGAAGVLALIRIVTVGR